MPDKVNLVFLLADQLRASSLPLYGEDQIRTPNLDRLAKAGTVFDNAISTCPVCTPYRSMLLTGRHPQTTGHLVNFVRTRHDEISIGDAFARAGYQTGWVGKWHLHTGSFPHVPGPDFVPEGRDRLGFQYWRGYNFHTQYFDGWVNKGDWRNERWSGYETKALAGYAAEFMDAAGDKPFCLFVSPHQPHHTVTNRFAPEDCYGRLPDSLRLPANVPESSRAQALEIYRHYLAMTLAIDDMVGDIVGHLEATGKARNTLIVFTSDHGTQMGAQGIHPWEKKQPYLESLRVPLIMSLPGTLSEGVRRDHLIAPVDFMPSLCRLCGVKTPRSVEGHDLSEAMRGVKGAFEQESVFTMNFTASYDYLKNGKEWRGALTKSHSYARWLDGQIQLFDIQEDPLEQRNLAARERGALGANKGLASRMEEVLAGLLAARQDAFPPCESCADWFDSRRRVVKNAFGPLGDPEQPPDWSLLY